MSNTLECCRVAIDRDLAQAVWEFEREYVGVERNGIEAVRADANVRQNARFLKHVCAEDSGPRHHKDVKSSRCDLGHVFVHHVASNQHHRSNRRTDEIHNSVFAHCVELWPQ